MASTNKTTNYELSQFEGTDKPSWEADYNADMLSIDTNLKAVSDVADGASGSISTLADRVTAAEGNISTNANDIDALEARADALESGETIADGRLDALEAEQLIQNTAIEGNTQLGYNLARPYDSASTYAAGAYVLFQNTLYKCTTAVSTGEAFDPNKWLAIKATDEIAAGGYTLPVASANTLGGVKIGKGLKIDNEILTTEIEELTSSDYLTFNTTFTSNNQNIVPRQITSAIHSDLYDLGGYYMLKCTIPLAVDCSTNVNLDGNFLTISGTWSNLLTPITNGICISSNGFWKNYNSTSDLQVEGYNTDTTIMFLSNNTFRINPIDYIKFTDDGAYAHQISYNITFIIPKSGS